MREGGGLAFGIVIFNSVQYLTPPHKEGIARYSLLHKDGQKAEQEKQKTRQNRGGAFTKTTVCKVLIFLYAIRNYKNCIFDKSLYYKYLA